MINVIIMKLSMGVFISNEVRIDMALCGVR